MITWCGKPEQIFPSGMWRVPYESDGVFTSIIFDCKRDAMEFYKLNK